MQLIYLTDVFEDNYDIVLDHFERDSVNQRDKNRPFVAKKRMKF